jgi:enoyl-CoA hydratase/carnithine racemase
VIAALNGHAVGVGITYPMLADVRIVSETAKIAFAFVRRGVLPELASHVVLARVVGLSRAAELLLTGKTITGTEAAAMGLASCALPGRDVLGAALEMARDIAQYAAPVERGTIEVAPIGFMRGRTLNDAFVILDEAQNTTSEQMKMFLTRLGFGSKAVVTGDITQVDLPTGRGSGLIEVQKVLRGVEGVAFCPFSEVDVVRHPLVQEVVRAYDVYDAERRSRAEAAKAGREAARAERERAAAAAERPGEVKAPPAE